MNNAATCHTSGSVGTTKRILPVAPAATVTYLQQKIRQNNKTKQQTPGLHITHDGYTARRQLYPLPQDTISVNRYVRQQQHAAPVGSQAFAPKYDDNLVDGAIIASCAQPEYMQKRCCGSNNGYTVLDAPVESAPRKYKTNSMKSRRSTGGLDLMHGTLRQLFF